MYTTVELIAKEFKASVNKYVQKLRGNLVEIINFKKENNYSTTTVSIRARELFFKTTFKNIMCIFGCPRVSITFIKLHDKSNIWGWVKGFIWLICPNHCP